MAYRIDWLVARRVLLTTLKGNISKEELQAFIEEIRMKIQSAELPVYHISNSLNMGKVELSLKALSDLVRSVSLIGDIGAQVDINHPRTLNTFFANVAAQVLRLKTYTVGSLDEAVALLKRTDRALDSVQWTFPPAEDLGVTAAHSEEKGA